MIDYLELALRIILGLGFMLWLFVAIYMNYQVAKLPHYLTIKQQYRNVEKAKIKAKYEYKLAVIAYKEKRDKAKAKSK